MTNTEIATRVDPFDASLKFLLVIVFPKSTSKNFPLALSISEGASKFAVADINGKPTYFVCFGSNASDAGRALAVLDYVQGWKGVQIFSKGKILQSTYLVSEVLKCYMDSQSCRDYTAHCYKIIDDPFSEEVESSGLSFSISIVEKPSIKQEIEIDRYSFPCKFLHNRFRFQKNHPASIEDQIQAGAVSQGCDWCPNFNPDNWKKVGVKKVLKEFFE